MVKSATSCEIVEAVKHELVAPNKEHYIKLDKDLVTKYKDYEFPIGVYMYNHGRYRVIDGYHRYQAFMNGKKEKCDIIVVN